MLACARSPAECVRRKYGCIFMMLTVIKMNYFWKSEPKDPKYDENDDGGTDGRTDGGIDSSIWYILRCLAMNQNVNHLFACFHYLITLLSFVSCFGFISALVYRKKKNNKIRNKKWRLMTKYFDALLDESLNKNITPVSSHSIPNDKTKQSQSLTTIETKLKNE